MGPPANNLRDSFRSPLPFPGWLKSPNLESVPKAVILFGNSLIPPYFSAASSSAESPPATAAPLAYRTYSAPHLSAARLKPATIHSAKKRKRKSGSRFRTNHFYKPPTSSHTLSVSSQTPPTRTAAPNPPPIPAR